MMRHKKSVTAAALLASLLFSGQVVANETKVFWNLQGKYFDHTSGTNVSSIVDTNGDGIPGNVATMRGRSSRGPVTITIFSEFNPFAAGPSPNCPDTMLEFPMVEGSLVIRFLRGDLLFLRTVEAVFCLDPLTGYHEFTNTSVVEGGTGKYEGATGTIDASGEGSSLSFDPTGILHFGWVTMTNEGTITRQ